VFITGFSVGATSGTDFATVAYNAVTGARLWVRGYNGPVNGDDLASSLVVSPNGGKVFVTGSSQGVTSGDDYATVAYNAATGAQLWVQRHHGAANRTDGAHSVAAVSPAGGRVFVTFVTGNRRGAALGNDYVTVSYSAATGAQLWVKRYHGPGNGGNAATAVAVSPNGGKVFVTGTSQGATLGNDYATVAYNAATGARLWVKRYNGPDNGDDFANSVAVSPNGRTVFVTGTSQGATSGDDDATVAYSS
jgi:WD40 repeat protein